MKKIYKLLMLFSALMMLSLFASCADDSVTDKPENPSDSLLGNQETVTFFIDWQNGEFKEEFRTAYFASAKADWYVDPPAFRKGHVLSGVYTEKMGQGTKVIDSVGNVLTDSFTENTTYYAHWTARDVFVSFRFEDENSDMHKGLFYDGSTRICKEYAATDRIDFVFPEVISDCAVLYWKNQSGVRISDGNVLYDKFIYISDLMSSAYPTLMSSVSDFVNLYPVLEDKTYILTLDFGTSIEEYELSYGEDIEDFLTTYSTGTREIVGWAESRYETLDFVTNGKIYSDMTLFAVWKDYSEITLVGVDENYFPEGYVIPSEDSRDDAPLCKKHIYQHEPQYIDTPLKEGYIFGGWYDNPDFTGEPVTRLVTYEKNAGTYYARFVKESYKVYVRYNDAVSGYGTYLYELLPDESLRYRMDLSEMNVQGGKAVVGIYDGDVLLVDADGYWVAEQMPNEDFRYPYYNVLILPLEYTVKLFYTDSDGIEQVKWNVTVKLVSNGDGSCSYVISDLKDILPESFAIEGIYSDENFENCIFDENGVSLVLIEVYELYVKEAE